MIRYEMAFNRERERESEQENEYFGMCESTMGYNFMLLVLA